MASIVNNEQPSTSECKWSELKRAAEGHPTDPNFCNVSEQQIGLQDKQIEYNDI